MRSTGWPACAHQPQLRTALNVRSPVLLGPVDPVQQGPFRAVVLEGVDVGVEVRRGLQLYFAFGNIPFRSSSLEQTNREFLIHKSLAARDL